MNIHIPFGALDILTFAYSPKSSGVPGDNRLRPPCVFLYNSDSKIKCLLCADPAVDTLGIRKQWVLNGTNSMILLHFTRQGLRFTEGNYLAFHGVSRVQYDTVAKIGQNNSHNYLPKSGNL
jgi:hypothetical protein